jgi:hypothetical protein
VRRTSLRIPLLGRLNALSAVVREPALTSRASMGRFRASYEPSTTASTPIRSTISGRPWEGPIPLSLIITLASPGLPFLMMTLATLEVG